MTADLGKEAFYASLAIIGFVLGMLGIHCHRWNSLLRVAAIFFGLFLCAFGLGSTLIVYSERVSAAPGIIIALSEDGKKIVKDAGAHARSVLKE